MVDQALFSSKNESWETPQKLFDKLNAQFCFNLDCAATEENKKCAVFLRDAFEGAWFGRCFLNPPYGRGIDRWMARANDQLKKGHASIIVALVPARVDTIWWNDHCARHLHRFIKGRLYFELDGKRLDAAPFPSALVYMGL